jgi:hypothetical protein
MKINADLRWGKNFASYLSFLISCMTNKLKLVLVFWAGFFLIISLSAQIGFESRKVAELSPRLEESSSLIYTPEGIFWSLNDGGNKAMIYAFDSTGILVDSLRLSRTKNEDWEAMAYDADTKTFYVGSTGNNDNHRDTLQIFCFQRPEDPSVHQVTPEKMNFTYPDKPLNDPLVRQCAFDCEAMIFFNDALYLFSKSRCAEKYTKCYRIEPGTKFQKAELLDSLLLKHWITSADISPDGKRLALLCETKLLLFDEFDGDDFFGGKLTELKLGVWTQKEGVAFSSENELWFTDETTAVDTGSLTRIVIK